MQKQTIKQHLSDFTSRHGKPFWYDSTPSDEDRAFWERAERRRLEDIREMTRGSSLPPELWTRKAEVPIPHYSTLYTNGQWSDWIVELEAGMCDILRACRISEENNPFTPEKASRCVPPSAGRKMALMEGRG